MRSDKENGPDQKPKCLLAGVFLVASGILALEIALTRVFSISLWYHFAFMSVGIAMLGLGASGALLYAFPSLNREHYLTWYAGFFGISIPCFMRQICSFTSDQFLLNNMGDFFRLTVFYLSTLVPFFLGGLALSTALSSQSFSFNKIYSWDLAGTAVGCALAPWAISHFGAQGVLLLAGALGVLAALAFPGTTKALKALIACVFFGIGLWSAFYFTFKDGGQVPVPSNKALYYYSNRAIPRADVLFSRWSALARVDVFAPLPATSWGLSSTYKGSVPPQIGITLDGDGFTSIVKESVPEQSLSFLDYLPASLPYSLLAKPKVMIIGSGGGIDVLIALRNRSASVTAVELNPVIVKLVKEEFREFSGDVYRKPGVKVICGEGRHVLRQSGEQFDLLYVPLVDSWASGASGAYTLSENYLYTLEAIEEYLDHLTENGILAINRWEKENRFQGIKICGTFGEALAQRGINDAGSHCAAVRSDLLSVFLFKKTPFTAKESEKLLNETTKRKFQVLHKPGQQDSIYAQALKRETRISLVRTSPFDLSPPTDDSPFFYKTFRWENFFQYIGRRAQGESIPAFITIFLVLFLFSGLFSLFFLILPLILSGEKLAKDPRTVAELSYFGCLGAGFMLCEVALLEKWILFLGHPLYATVIVLFALLLFSGIGSLASSNLFSKNPEKGIRIIIPLIAVLCLIHAYPINHLQHLSFSWLWQARVFFAIISIAPIGFFLGMPFPVGISIFAGDLRLVPWAWGVNACLSVAGSVFSVFIGSFLGFSAVLAFAALIYLGGLLCIVRK